MIHYRSAHRLLRLYGRAFLRGFTVRRFMNALRTEWAYRRRRLDVRSMPYVLFIEPLYYCNLECPLCPRQMPAFHSHKGKLEIDLIRRTFSEVGPYLFQCSIFGNGEPTLDWSRTAEVIAVALGHNVFTSVSTNATLITPVMAEKIVTSGLDYLICAIDGVSQEAYAKYRVGGDVRDALNGLRYVLEAKRRLKSNLLIEWQYLVNAYNEGEIEQARALARELGVPIRFAPIGGMGKDPAEQERWAAKNPKYRQLIERPGVPNNAHHCYWLWRSIYINASGTMGRCPKYSGPNPIGDLREQSIAEIYNSRASQLQRHIFHPGPLPAEERIPAPCDTCELYVRCHEPGACSGTESPTISAELAPSTG
jgi:radical SAM protein with 4Fe4S-binding SPASM domain